MKRVKNICLLGTTMWSKRLEVLLNKYAGEEIDTTAVHLSISSFLCKIMKLIRTDVLIRVGFRPAILRPRAIVFDVLWLLVCLLNPRAQLIYYWIGTDVIKAVETNRRGMSIWSKYMFRRAKKCRHFAAAPWLVAELASIGFEAEDVLFPSALKAPKELLPLPDVFSVFSYVPDHRYKFYGGDVIYEVAKRFPEVPFHIVAGVGCWVTDPLPNLHFHGWQEDIGKFYQNCTVVVRLVQHDALGGTVREGMAFARYVIYSYPIPYTIKVMYGDIGALYDQIFNLYELHRRGELTSNGDARDFSLSFFDESYLINMLLSKIVLSH